MRPIFRLTFLVLAALILSGCVSRKEIIQFQRDLADIKQRTRVLEERSARLDSLLTAHEQILQTMKAEMSLYSDQMQQRLNNLEASLEDLGSLYSQSYNRKPARTTAPVYPDTSTPAADTAALLGVDPKKLYNPSYLHVT